MKIKRYTLKSIAALMFMALMLSATNGQGASDSVIETTGAISGGPSETMSPMADTSETCLFSLSENGPAMFSKYHMDLGIWGVRMEVPPDLSRVKVGDFDGDGRMDFAYIEGFGRGCEKVAIYLSNGDGTFNGDPYSALYVKVDGSIGGSTVDLARLKPADFNGDGMTDIAWVDGYGDTAKTLKIHLAEGGGTFGTIDTGLPFHVEGSTTGAPVDLSRFKLGDYNGDGKTDIAWVDGWGQPNKPLQVYLSNGDGTFFRVPTPGIDFYVHDSIKGAHVDLARFKLGDFNGDGRTDIAWVDGYGDTAKTLKIHLSAGDGTFNRIDSGLPFHVEGSTTGAPVDLARFKLGDYNGDGKTDIAWVDGWGERKPLQVYLSNGDGTFWRVPEPGVAFLVDDSIKGARLDLARLKPGDYNGDGRTDIAWVDGIGKPEKTLKVFFANGDGSFRSVDTGLTLPVHKSLSKARIDVERVVSGDFNGDGVEDLARINCWNEKEPTSIYLMGCAAKE